MINKKENRSYRRGVGKYYPTTLEEAVNKVYFVRPVRNNNGDYSSGVVCFPKVLNGRKIKIKVVS